MAKRIQTDYGCFFTDRELTAMVPKPAVLKERSFLKDVETAFRKKVGEEGTTLNYVVTLNASFMFVEQEGEDFVFKDIDYYSGTDTIVIHDKVSYRVKADTFRLATTLLKEEQLAYSYELRLVE